MRGFDSVSAVWTPEGVVVFINEVKTTAGNIVPSKLSALGLNRPSTFLKNLRVARGKVRRQVGDDFLLSATLEALEQRTFTVRLIGPPGIRISPATRLRIQQTTGARAVETLELLQP